MTLKETANPWRLISLDELSKHSDAWHKDAWIAVNGVVYDISAFASQRHPGGMDKIVKYAGQDVTDVFNSIHPYVIHNIGTILQGCQVGVVKGDPRAPKKGLISRCFGDRYKPPITYYKQDSIIMTYVVDFIASSREHDWTAGVTGKRTLHVFKRIDKNMGWHSVHDMPEPLENDEVALNIEGGFSRAEITLRKPMPTTDWPRQMHALKKAGRFVPLNRSYSKFDAFIIYKKCLTSNILMFGMQVNSAKINVPLGFYVNIHIGELCRPYTPVCFRLVHPDGEDAFNQEHDNPPTVLNFMIKIYPKGKLTKALDKIPLDEGEEVPTLEISTPFGYFDSDFLKDFNLLLLIAGGSGISPMIRIIETLCLAKDKVHGKRIGLIYFCDNIYDIIREKEFKMLEEKTSWFFFFPVLTKPSKLCNWEGLRGMISESLVSRILRRIPHDPKEVRKACICGTPAFNASCTNALSDIIELGNVFVFTN